MIIPNAEFERPSIDLQPADLVAEIFRPGGWLESTLDLQFRPQQEAMARRVAYHFARDTPLLFEAGTGVGKSLAYLIPGILFSVAENRPLIVSSHTIALQEQILHKDLEICRKLFRLTPQLQAFKDFRSAILLGRGNYVCAKRLRRSTTEQTELFEFTAREQLNALNQWCDSTSEGLRQELDFRPHPDIWDAINAESSACNRKECPAKECFYHKARARVEQSHVLILNHSLFFSLLNAGMGPAGDTPGVLLPHDRVVFDEAHTVPSIATRHLGLSLSSFGLERFLKRLYNPTASKGFLHKNGDTAARQLVSEALDAASEFFGTLEHVNLSRLDVVRIVEKHWYQTPLLDCLQRLTRKLKSLGTQAHIDSLIDEFRDFSQQSTSYALSLQTFLAAEDESVVYWIEKTGSGRRPIIHLNTAPLDVGPLLQELLFSRENALLLTSATLDTGDDLSGFKAKVGAGCAPHGIESSPFDYENQVEIFLSVDCPEPTQHTDRQSVPPYLEYWSQAIAHLAASIRGGTLLLFTSYRDMLAVHRLAQDRAILRDRRLLLQKEGSNRSILLESFRSDGSAVLFGTESFWTGIDVPGPALSQVVITRLPFENPSHPIAEARSEFIRQQGENPFVAMTLPEAILKFRQGIGRLIRSTSDTGRIVVLDSRILRKPYGGRFISVLPNSRYRRFALPDLATL
ncbi:MAG: ATP-dependent DNA helicase [Puniceicoccaceae bacterium]